LRTSLLTFWRRAKKKSQANNYLTWDFGVEAMGLEPTNLLTASQALYQLSYAPSCEVRG
jgi:hypothetical protein